MCLWCFTRGPVKSEIKAKLKFGVRDPSRWVVALTSYAR